jgi:hypothetical protein
MLRKPWQAEPTASFLVSDPPSPERLHLGSKMTCVAKMEKAKVTDPAINLG